MNFQSIPGLDEIKQLLIGSVERQHVAHAQLFLGSEGSGALALALAYAAYINCLQPTASDSCGTCANCSKIHKHVHPDVHYVMPVTTTKAHPKDVHAQLFLPEWRAFLAENPYGTLIDWTQLIGSENKQALIAREESRHLIRTLALKAFEAPFKIMLIWLPELMNPQTANALLKVFEEPPAQTIFLLVSNDSDKLLPTIRSRCQMLHVRPFSDEETIGYLTSTQGITAEASRQIAQLSEGNLQAARQLANEISDDYFELFRSWMRASFSSDLAKIMTLSEEFQKLGRENQKTFLQYALALLRKCILAGVDPSLAISSSAEEEEFFHKFGPLLRNGNRDELAHELSQAHYHIERNANPKILFTDLSLTAGALLKPAPAVA